MQAGIEHFLLLAALICIQLAQAHERAKCPGVKAGALGLGVDIANVVGGRLFFFLKALDAFNESFQLVFGKSGWLGFFFFSWGGWQASTSP